MDSVLSYSAHSTELSLFFLLALSAPLCGSLHCRISRTPRLAPPTPLCDRRFAVGALALRSRYFTTTRSAV